MENTKLPQGDDVSLHSDGQAGKNDCILLTGELFKWHKETSRRFAVLEPVVVFNAISKIICREAGDVTVVMMDFSALPVARMYVQGIEENPAITDVAADEVEALMKSLPGDVPFGQMDAGVLSPERLSQFQLDARHYTYFIRIQVQNRNKAVLLLNAALETAQTAQLLSCLFLILENYFLINETGLGKEEFVSEKPFSKWHLANLSHQLLTPLNSVLGFCRLLKDEQLRDKQVEYINYIQNAGTALKSAINDVIDMYALEQGCLVIEEYSVSISELFTSLKDRLQHIAVLLGVTLNIYQSPGLPDIIVIDGRILKRIISEITLCAIDLAGEEEVELFLSNTLTSGTTGVAEIRLVSAICPPPDKKSIGTVAQFVKELGGTFTMETGVNYGNEATIHLPYHLPVESADTHSHTHGSASYLKGLIVEDNLQNARLLKQILALKNIKSDYAESGSKALQMIGDNQYDFTLMDLHMPGLNGIETITALRSRSDEKATLPAIILTADIVHATRRTCLEAGFDEFINKPFMPDELFDKLYKVLDADKLTENIVLADIDNEQVMPDEPAEVVTTSTVNIELNFDYLREFSNGDKDFEKDILESSVQEINQKIAILQTDFSNNDFRAIMLTAHSLKSLCSIVGSSNMYNYFKWMEEAYGHPDHTFNISTEHLAKAVSLWENTGAQLQVILEANYA